MSGYSLLNSAMYRSATGVSGVQPHQLTSPDSAAEGPVVAEVVSSVEPPPPEHAASASEAAATAASAAALRVRNAPIPRWVMEFPLSSGPTSSLGPVWEKVPVYVVRPDFAHWSWFRGLAGR